MHVFTMSLDRLVWKPTPMRYPSSCDEFQIYTDGYAWLTKGEIVFFLVFQQSYQLQVA